MPRLVFGLLAVWGIAFGQWAMPACAADSPALFDRQNLVAWCIVPFDAQKRGPEERAAMLAKLGVRKFAYDYRAEHIPTFDAEVEALRRHGIELTAWWFPTELNAEARTILDVLRRHNIKTQLWVTGGGEPTRNAAEQQARIESEVQRLRPIAEAAAEIGCTVGLYNHGGWFGEPDNQIAIIRQLGRKNVGIVYNLHHGHTHVADFTGLLQRMLPYLYVLNLNGMVAQGDQVGKKILPLGAGDLELGLLKTIRDSGYQGPIGILNHTEEDAEGRLLDNLDGLQWLEQQLDGKPPGPPPTYRTWRPPPDPALQGGRVFPGRDAFRQPPITLECRASLARHDVYNILVACDTKASSSHWELFTEVGTGHLTVYLPGARPDHVRSATMVCDGRMHDFAMTYEPGRVQLFVDGRRVADQVIEPGPAHPVPGDFAIGRLVEGTYLCYGTIDAVRISRGIVALPRLAPPDPTDEATTLGDWKFGPEENVGTESTLNISAARVDEFPTQPSDTMKSHLVTQAMTLGDSARGLAWFGTPTTACLSCHRVGEVGGSVGPPLTQIGKDRRPDEIVESVLWPKHKIAPEFVQWVITTTDGGVHRGYRTTNGAGQIVLRDPSTGDERQFDPADVEDQTESGTLMPDGLMAAIPPEKQLDLLRFLFGLGTDRDIPHDQLAATLTRLHQQRPAVIDFDRQPLHPHNWEHWQHRVNRDRLYDWYAKQADHFRSHPPLPALLGEFPGLDGGDQGHWGNQNEDVWADGRWNNVDLGIIQAGVFHGPDITVPRGICVRIGRQRELSVCFNPDTLTYDAVWSGGFVTFSAVRHGFLDGLKMAGHLVPDSPRDKPPQQPFRYQGYYRRGEQIVFAYRLGEVDYLDAPMVENGRFVRNVGPRDQHPLRDVLGGGPEQWPQQLTTRIIPGQQRPYAVDTVELPQENPWNALFFCADHDFLPDGSALVCTMHGDVWRVQGLDSGTDQAGRAQWRRFASGLHHPLGLVVDGDSIYVQCRDQLARLHDLNQDGEADFYECFSNAFVTSPAGHDFICGLQRDRQGNFYTVSGNQGLLRISPQGDQAEIVAHGFRNPDGLGMMADGTITVPCSEGEWTPASMICAVPPPGDGKGELLHYGYGGPRTSRGPELPMLYIPRGIDNSSGGQVLVTDNRWGPVQGAMVHLSFGAGTHFLLLTDTVGERKQGGLVPLAGDFRSGAHRGKFRPQDGQLYVTGMAGWGSYTPEDGCFQRVRYRGDAVQFPVGFHVHENGIILLFASELSAEVVENHANHFAQCWNYRYSSAYGSPEYSTRQFGVRGHDVLEITQAHLVADRRQLFLELPDLQPTNMLHLRLQCDAETIHELFATVHALDPPFTEFPGYRPRVKQIAPHPMQLDLAIATKVVPNPWRHPIASAREIRMDTDKNLTYAKREIRVTSGESIRLTLVNADVVPHNWALLRPGALERVGLLANRLVSDPEAVASHYVPQTPDVLVSTDIVHPGGEFSVYFRAPSEPGKYPYLCTFPGHWMVMHGMMVVE